MDIQKEREAFESVFTEAKGWDLTFIMGCYQNIETLRAFAGWLAAKAQAVPEGFVLVPKEPTDIEIESIKEKHWDMRGCQLCKSDYIDLYKAMIEAQEQHHD